MWTRRHRLRHDRVLGATPMEGERETGITSKTGLRNTGSQATPGSTPRRPAARAGSGLRQRPRGGRKAAATAKQLRSCLGRTRALSAGSTTVAVGRRRSPYRARWIRELRTRIERSSQRGSWKNKLRGRSESRSQRAMGRSQRGRADQPRQASSSELLCNKMDVTERRVRWYTWLWRCRSIFNPLGTKPHTLAS